MKTKSIAQQKAEICGCLKCRGKSGNQDWEKELLEIGVRNHTLMSLSMKTGEYDLLPEVKSFISHLLTLKKKEVAREILEKADKEYRKKARSLGVKPKRIWLLDFLNTEYKPMKTCLQCGEDLSGRAKDVSPSHHCNFSK